jgi:adenylate cyclase class 2
MSARQTLPTYREVEIKLRVADTSAILRRIRRLGAKPFGRALEQNTLYDTPDADFRSRGRLLRLRIETPASSRGRIRAVLTSKAPAPAQKGRGPGPRKPRFKEKAERERIIQDPGRWPKILRTLGLRPGFRYEKYRSEFRLPGVHVCLDETPVGTFLELEGTPHGIDRTSRALGFTHREYLRGTYWDVYAADCCRRGLAPRNMVFRR